MNDDRALLHAWIYYKLRDDSLSIEERKFAEAIKDVVVENEKLRTEIKDLKHEIKCIKERKRVKRGTALAH